MEENKSILADGVSVGEEYDDSASAVDMSGASVDDTPVSGAETDPSARLREAGDTISRAAREAESFKRRRAEAGYADSTDDDKKREAELKRLAEEEKRREDAAEEKRVALEYAESYRARLRTERESAALKKKEEEKARARAEEKASREREIAADIAREREAARERGARTESLLGRKTLLGALTNFVISTACAAVISSVYSLELGIVNCIFIGILSTELELVTSRGLDNVLVTWGATALTYGFMYFADVNAYLVPIIFTPLIVMLCVQKKALTSGGIIAAIVLDIAASIAFGNKGFIILCTFFVGSITVDKIKKHYENQSRNNDVKGECRNYMQVLVNGMIAFLCSISFIVTKNSIFAVPFVASLGEAFADTVASGIGTLSKRTYDPFRRQKCENGLSGGMSLIGTFSSFLAALIISVIAYCLGFNNFGFAELLIVTLCAFLGGIFDSFLGSLFQIKYRCTECGKITEREEHCDTQTVRYSGFAFIDNDIVNLLSCTFSAVLATVLVMVL